MESSRDARRSPGRSDKHGAPIFLLPSDLLDKCLAVRKHNLSGRIYEFSMRDRLKCALCVCKEWRAVEVLRRHLAVSNDLHQFLVPRRPLRKDHFNPLVKVNLNTVPARGFLQLEPVVTDETLLPLLSSMNAATVRSFKLTQMNYSFVIRGTAVPALSQSAIATAAHLLTTLESLEFDLTGPDRASIESTLRSFATPNLLELKALKLTSIKEEEWSKSIKEGLTIPSSTASEVLSLAACASKLETLYLQNEGPNLLTPEFVTALAARWQSALGSRPVLSKLIVETDLTLLPWSIMTPLSSAFPAMQVLRLGINGFDGEIPLDPFPQLRELELFRGEIGRDDFDKTAKLVEALRSVLAACPAIQKLSLSPGWIADYDEGWNAHGNLPSLGDGPFPFPATLTSLNLHNFALKPDNLDPALLPNLEELTLHECGQHGTTCARQQHRQDRNRITMEKQFRFQITANFVQHCPKLRTSRSFKHWQKRIDGDEDEDGDSSLSSSCSSDEESD